MAEPREPAVIAQIDQLGARMESVAEVLGQFNRALIYEGFEPADALVLVRDYFDCYMPMRGEDDDD